MHEGFLCCNSPKLVATRQTEPTLPACCGLTSTTRTRSRAAPCSARFHRCLALITELEGEATALMRSDSAAICYAFLVMFRERRTHRCAVGLGEFWDLRGRWRRRWNCRRRFEECWAGLREWRRKGLRVYGFVKGFSVSHECLRNWDAKPCKVC
jgi:hypothetical protein